ncbi:MAG: bifunctional oligoribonuclease/PAP phosphatase NrnA [Bacteroidales bacterium]|nr:bifunctional oligoribonuclease/PAP phosphatase NrnA [Bacteroidales bacterium]MCF8336513.1 bifunctional oligoribonuclease/PAP phosphatase NrnA [Bacteroidales bacterium]
MKIKNLDTLKAKIQQSQEIVLTSHRHPDGDAIGSMLGLYHFLRITGANLHLIVPDNYPSFLKWLPGSDNILIYENQASTADSYITRADLIFALDYNDFSRTEKMEKKLKKASAYKVMIDHHPEPDTEAFDLVYSWPGYSSTAEIIYTLCHSIDTLNKLDKPAAIALYAGILTDTGSFSYSVNRPELFETIAQLLRLGIDAEKISRNIYDTYSESRLRLLGYSITHRMKVLGDLATVYIYLTQEDMEYFNYQDGDTEGLVNYGLSIKGINFSVLMKENPGVVRLSMRSKEGFSVNQFARTHFDGGGHEKAAGANSYMSLSDTIKKFESLLPQYKNQLTSINE